MEKENNTESLELQKRTKKITTWLKNPYNSALLGVIIFALAIRLYFFWITKGQAIWWDEGEYLLRVKHLVLDTPQSGFFRGRELFTPYFWAAIYWITGSEVVIRFVQVIISGLTVLATYFLGKEVYNKKTGILAAAFLSFFWLHLFFTCRLLTYLYAPLFYTLALALFWKGYISDSESNDKKRNLYLFLSFLILVLGIGIYTSIVFAAPVILIYLLVTEKLSFIKSKRLWLAALKSIIFLPVVIIPSYLVQGSFFPRVWQVGHVLETEIGAGFQKGLFTYTNMLPSILKPSLLILLIIALLWSLFRLVIGADLLFKSKNMSIVKKDFFILVSAAFPFAFYTWYSMISGGPSGASYDAWILPIFPMLFCLIASVLLATYSYSIKTFKINKKIVFLVFAAIFLFVAYQHITFANSTIKDKAPSFYGLKVVGEWLKENTVPGDLIFSAAVPELTYYTEREIISHDNCNSTKEQCLKYINEVKPKFIVMTLWEKYPEWVYSLPSTGELNLTVEMASFLDSERKQPDTIAYRIHYN